MNESSFLFSQKIAKLKVLHAYRIFFLNNKNIATKKSFPKKIGCVSFLYFSKKKLFEVCKTKIRPRFFKLKILHFFLRLLILINFLLFFLYIFKIIFFVLPPYPLQKSIERGYLASGVTTKFFFFPRPKHFFVCCCLQKHFFIELVL